MNDVTEDIAKEIEQLSESMRKLQSGRLNQRAIILLLKDITGLKMTDIKSVLDGAASLDEYFLKDDKE